MAVVEAALPSIASFPGVQTMEGKHLENVSARFQVGASFLSLLLFSASSLLISKELIGFSCVTFLPPGSRFSCAR